MFLLVLNTVFLLNFCHILNEGFMPVKLSLSLYQVSVERELIVNYFAYTEHE